MEFLVYGVAFSVAWLIIIFGSGYVAHRLSSNTLEALPFVTRTYHWEFFGKIYERLWIRTWKDRFPEAGDFYSGGISKSTLPAKMPDGLAIFRRETVRAEFSHWLTWVVALSFFLWVPANIAVGMMILGAMINVPPILIQRYNRARLARISMRRSGSVATNKLPDTSPSLDR